MCGIFGYIGAETNVATMSHRALCDLEYRGYDSWGIVAAPAASGAPFFVRKAVGKVSGVPKDEFLGVEGTMALGHSRWATHGGVTVANAHPHFNHAQTIAVVHNGIIENHRELRQFLGKDGLTSEDFLSETDTEVIPHLIEHFMAREGKTFEQAFVATANMLEGRFAFVAMHRGDNMMLGVRDGSPLVVGKNGVGHFFASDIPALLDHTRRIYFLNDREYAAIKGMDVMVRSLDSGAKVNAGFMEVAWEKEAASKEGYPHFMLKEIMEEGRALDHAIRQDDTMLTRIALTIKRAERVFLVGCGTAAKMAKIGEIALADVAGVAATAIVGSEFAPYAKFLNRRSVVIAVSQSGETADVLEALRAAKKAGAHIVSVLNVVGSSIDRMSDDRLFINVGPEIAVASTKAAIGQAAVLLMLAHAATGKLGNAKHDLRGAVRDLMRTLTPELSQEILAVAKTIAHENDLYIIGRGYHAPTAHEAAIKIQEVSYIHAEGFPGGELKHGPIALIRPGTPVIAFMPNDDTKRDMESNVTELRARGAHVIGIAPEGNRLFDEWIRVPDCGIASPIASLIPVQLLAYHLAVLRGNDPDKPRNLAKSVTVK